MFNSLKNAKKLEAAGFSREQAETQMQIMTELIETNLATKEDIKDVRTEIRELEYRLAIKLGTIVSIAVGVAVALAKLV